MFRLTHWIIGHYLLFMVTSFFHNPAITYASPIAASVPMTKHMPTMITPYGSSSETTSSSVSLSEYAVSGAPLFPFAYSSIEPQLEALALEHDKARLHTDQYTTVTLNAPYPAPSVEEELMYYFAIQSIAVKHRFESTCEINHFLLSNPIIYQNVNEILIGIDLYQDLSFYDWDKTKLMSAFDTLRLLSISANKTITFRFFFTYPPLTFWKSLSTQEQELLLNTYHDVFTSFVNLPNVVLYFPGSKEWLVGNSGNFTSDGLPKTDVAQFMFRVCLVDMRYQVMAENLNTKLDELSDLLKIYPLTFDLQDKKLVFFGDSILGNYRDNLSIPGVIQEYSGAKIYNLARGGSCAAITEEKISFPELVELLGSENVFTLSPQDQSDVDMRRFREDTYRYKRFDEVCFIVNFGLNDYFAGLPILSSDTNDKLDNTTYYGALRTGIETLKTSYPGCTIILLSPTYIHLYREGQEGLGESGAPLSLYRQAAKMAASDSGISYLDAYHDLGVRERNYSEFLYGDEVHFSEAGRFLMGMYLLQKLE